MVAFYAKGCNCKTLGTIQIEKGNIEMNTEVLLFLRVPSDQAKPATESVPPPLPAEGPPTAAAAVPANTDAPPPLPTSAVPEKKEDK